MVAVKVNFADVQDFDAVPEGTYDAVIEKIEYREPKEKGKSPYLNVEYTITDGEYEGRKLWEILSWSPKALFRMRDFFRAAGYDDDEYDLDIDEESNLLLEPDLTGEAVELTVENEIYNKKEVNRVVHTEFVTPPGGDGEDEDDEDEEEKAPAPAKKKTSKKAPEPVEEDEDEDDDEDDEDDGEDADAEDEEEAEAPTPITKAKSAKASATAPEKKSFRPTTTGKKKASTKRTFR